MARDADTLFVRRFDGDVHPSAAAKPPGRHDHFTLALWLAGQGTFELNGVLAQLETGHAQLVPAGVPHRLVHARRAEVVALGFCGTCFELDPALLAPFDRVRRGGSFTVRPRESGHLAHLLGALERELRGEGAALVTRSLLILILVELERAHRASGGPTKHALPAAVADALALIERRCLEPGLGLRDVAAAVGRSPAHLTTVVRRATGRTVQQWITVGRMGEARRLLAQTALAIDEVAERLGYADPRHFRRVFQRDQGVSPSAFRALAAHDSTPVSPRPPEARPSSARD